MWLRRPLRAMAARKTTTKSSRKYSRRLPSSLNPSTNRHRAMLKTRKASNPGIRRNSSRNCCACASSSSNKCRSNHRNSPLFECWWKSGTAIPVVEKVYASIVCVLPGTVEGSIRGDCNRSRAKPARHTANASMTPNPSEARAAQINTTVFIKSCTPASKFKLFRYANPSNGTASVDSNTSTRSPSYRLDAAAKAALTPLSIAE
jgi:hypothetical protein